MKNPLSSLRARRLLSGGALLILASCGRKSAPPAGGPLGPGGAVPPSDTSLTLGNLSGATPDPRRSDNYLIEYPEYALSYNAREGRPNWVSWHLRQADLGRITRGQFHPDTTLPPGYYRVVPRDYSNTGYDRGHNCPSNDRSASREANDGTFRTTNIMPQAPGNNQGPWSDLESYTRSLVRQGNEAYVVCGGSGMQGTIAQGRVSIPADTWKVILLLPDQPGNDIARITPQTRVIAVRMSNQDGVREQNWRTFRVRVDDIERATGYRFFTNVPPAVAGPLKQVIDTSGGKRSRRSRTNR